jgi:soluble lytic murein transglycosylase
MSLLRACFLSTTLLAGGFALAAESPSGTVVMLPPSVEAGGIAVRPSRLHYLTAPEHDLFVRAFDAASRGDWVAARGIAAQGQNRLARQLLEWRYALDKNSGATFAEIDAVIRDTDAKGTAQWPLRGTLQARAEAALPTDPSLGGMSPAQVVAWFGSKTPNSSIGKIRLGEALVATGDKTRGALLIRQGWADGSFAPDVELAIVQKDAALLTAADDRARLDTLLWRGETSAARRVMARVDAATAEIANARIALTSGLPKAEAVVSTLRDTSDPGLLFDWSRQLRIADRDGEAHALLLRIPAAGMVREHAARWWAESSIQARDALTAGDPRLALRIVQHAGFTSGDQYAEQQFLAGFIALRFLKEPSTALAHFQRLDAAVARPISKSRAQYWQGRAYEALNDNASALSHYKQAAAYPETFYGQIALAHTDPTPMLHLNDTAVEAAPPSELETAPLMDAIKVLADLGQAASLRAFVDRDVEVHSSPRQVKRLMMLLVEWGYPEIAVRLAKSAGYAGTALPAFTHPLIALPPYAGPGAGADPAGDGVRRLCRVGRGRARVDADDAGLGADGGQGDQPALSARSADG